MQSFKMERERRGMETRQRKRDREAKKMHKMPREKPTRKIINIIRLLWVPFLTIERCPVAVGECPLEL